MDRRSTDFIAFEGVRLSWNAFYTLILLVFEWRDAEMPCLKVFEALTVGFELTGDFACMVIPLLGGSEADAESGVVLGVIEINYLSEDGLFSESEYP
jgi:hypothetical protein